ncbi:MAG: alpha-glucosidase C-terminal domain-containing protein, partial [Flavitalea sp.]
LAEANMWPEDSASYFGNGDECHMNYHFPVMPRMFMALQKEDRYPITDIFDQTPEIPDTCQWAIFLRNHDELTLEMVTDEERDYMYKAYAKDPKAKINLGIRHRLAPLMENNRNKMELMNVLLFSLSGTPVIYYGDEIGMGDNFYLGDRDGVRTPMQWSPDRNAGFSNANPQKLYLPLILDPEYHYEAVNVETQKKNPSSLLWFMKQLIQMRKKYAAFSRGNMKFINLENPKVLVFTRNFQDETLLVIVNLSRYAQATQLDLIEFKGYQPTELFSRNNFPIIKEDGQYPVTLGPHGYYWLKLDKVHSEIFENKLLPELKLKHWSDLTETNIVDQLGNNIIPSYLRKLKWFQEKNSPVFNINFSNSVSFDISSTGFTFLLFDVIDETGVGDTFLLPATFIENTTASKYTENNPQAVVCRMKIGATEGILYDAYYLPELQSELIYRMAGNESISGKNQEIKFSANENLKNYVAAHTDIRARVLPVDDTNTSIGYDNKFFLKLYRHVDRTMNPDVEITHFLTEHVNLEQVPSFVGTIEWKSANEIIVLGMMQIMVEYHGNGRSYMLERLNNYYERITARQTHPAFELKGTLTDPLSFSMFPDDLKEFIGGTVAEGIQLIGIRTGDMHKALASGVDIKDFAPEEFSLHYQRSLFAGLQSLVRAAFQDTRKNIDRLSPDVRAQAEEVLTLKDILLRKLKTVYAKKMDIVKIRIHGNYDLKQILFTGKDIAILDFHGEPTRSYSDRRLKRSALLDIASMIRSIHYTTHEGLVLHKNITREEKDRMLPFAQMWTHYVTGIFMDAYLRTVKGSNFIPENKDDLKVLLETFLLEKAIQGFRYEVNNRPDWVIVPLQIIKSLLRQSI